MLLRRIWMLIDLSTSELKSDPPPTDKLRKSSRGNVTYSYYIMHPHTVNKNTTTIHFSGGGCCFPSHLNSSPALEYGMDRGDT